VAAAYDSFFETLDTLVAEVLAAESDSSEEGVSEAEAEEKTGASCDSEMSMPGLMLFT
jgi:hypothetical protein